MPARQAAVGRMFGHHTVVVHRGQHGGFTEVAGQPLADARGCRPLGKQRIARIGAKQTAHRQPAFGGARLGRAGVAQVGFVFDGGHVLMPMAFGPRAPRRPPHPPHGRAPPGAPLLAAVMRDQAVAEHLQQLHQHQQQDHGDQGHVGVRTLVAVAERQVAQATGTDRTAHRGETDQGHGGDRGTGDQARARLRQQHAGDQLPGGGAHRLGRFDHAAVNLAQRGLDQARIERRSTNDQRHDRAAHAQRGAHQEQGDRDQHDHQDDEGHRTQQVHHQRQHPIGQRPALHLRRTEQVQQHAQRQADGQGQRQRTEQHQQGIKGGLADIGPLARIQVAEEAAGSGDAHRRSSSTCTPAATNAACAADWSPPTRATTSWPYGVSLIRSMRPDRML
ncbi:hypothetical protein G6F22_014170 [Rhizopus arrhizus]|nr:hypothetical protein G6F22_014170 [Rhizopus arrhizus]